MEHHGQLEGPHVEAWLVAAVFGAHASSWPAPDQ